MRCNMLIAVTLLASSLPAAELITNGDFTAGLTGWNVTNAGFGLGGTVEVLPGLDVLSPSAGQLAVLTTGPAAQLGSSTATYVELSQDIQVLSADTYQLSFNYSFLTSLFTGPFADPNALDRFQVELRPTAGPITGILNGDVSSNNFLLFPASPAVTPGGSNFFEYTSLQMFQQDYALTPGTYTLAFRVENDLDSLFDSGMGVNSISFSSANGGPVVPEPSTFVLLAGGLLAAGVAKRTGLLTSFGKRS